ncbi:hypothetical protein CSUI_005336, partial [Cystoisospora suis]
MSFFTKARAGAGSRFGTGARQRRRYMKVRENMSVSAREGKNGWETRQPCLPHGGERRRARPKDNPSSQREGGGRTNVEIAKNLVGCHRFCSNAPDRQLPLPTSPLPLVAKPGREDAGGAVSWARMLNATRQLEGVADEEESTSCIGLCVRGLLYASFLIIMLVRSVWLRACTRWRIQRVLGRLFQFFFVFLHPRYVLSCASANTGEAVGGDFRAPSLPVIPFIFGNPKTERDCQTGGSSQGRKAALRGLEKLHVFVVLRSEELLLLSAGESRARHRSSLAPVASSCGTETLSPSSSFQCPSLACLCKGFLRSFSPLSSPVKDFSCNGNFAVSGFVERLIYPCIMAAFKARVRYLTLFDSAGLCGREPFLSRTLLQIAGRGGLQVFFPSCPVSTSSTDSSCCCPAGHASVLQLRSSGGSSPAVPSATSGNSSPAATGRSSSCSSSPLCCYVSPPCTRCAGRHPPSCAFRGCSERRSPTPLHPFSSRYSCAGEGFRWPVCSSRLPSSSGRSAFAFLRFCSAPPFTRLRTLHPAATNNTDSCPESLGGPRLHARCSTSGSLTTAFPDVRLSTRRSPHRFSYSPRSSSSSSVLRCSPFERQSDEPTQAASESVPSDTFPGQSRQEARANIGDTSVSTSRMSLLGVASSLDSWHAQARSYCLHGTAAGDSDKHFVEGQSPPCRCGPGRTERSLSNPHGGFVFAVTRKRDTSLGCVCGLAAYLRETSYGGTQNDGGGIHLSGGEKTTGRAAGASCSNRAKAGRAARTADKKKSSSGDSEGQKPQGVSGMWVESRDAYEESNDILLVRILCGCAAQGDLVSRVPGPCLGPPRRRQLRMIKGVEQSPAEAPGTEDPPQGRQGRSYPEIRVSRRLASDCIRNRGNAVGVYGCPDTASSRSTCSDSQHFSHFSSPQRFSVGRQVVLRDSRCNSDYIGSSRRRTASSQREENKDRGNSAFLWLRQGAVSGFACTGSSAACKDMSSHATPEDCFATTASPDEGEKTKSRKLARRGQSRLACCPTEEAASYRRASSSESDAGSSRGTMTAGPSSTCSCRACRGRGGCVRRQLPQKITADCVPLGRVDAPLCNTRDIRDHTEQSVPRESCSEREAVPGRTSNISQTGNPPVRLPSVKTIRQEELYRQLKCGGTLFPPPLCVLLLSPPLGALAAALIHAAIRSLLVRPFKTNFEKQPSFWHSLFLRVRGVCTGSLPAASRRMRVLCLTGFGCRDNEERLTRRCSTFGRLLVSCVRRLSLLRNLSQKSAQCSCEVHGRLKGATDT